MKTRSETFLHGNNLPWAHPETGVTRQMLGYDDRLMMVKVHFETGAVGSEHTHPHSQATLVASGRFEVHIGDKTAILGPGDGYYVAPDQPHGCTCLEAGTLIDTFSPMREEFVGGKR